MQTLVHTISEASYLLMSYLTHISSRLCLVYFIPMLIVTYLIALKRGRGLSEQLHSIKANFKSRWLGRSARQDYALIILNVSLKVIFFSHLVVLGLDFAVWTSDRLTDCAGAVDLGLPLIIIMVAYTTVLTLVDDLSVYLVHRWMHTSPLLWSFHSVHHSATQLTPLTWLRIHPVEGVINTLRRALVYGLITGSFMFLSGGIVSEVTLLGVNIFSLIFFVMGANLRHSHVPFSYGHRLEHIFISPLQHQIHHSVAIEHQNCNFGSKFAIWDRVFGTLTTAKQVKQPLQFGVSDPQQS